MMTSVKNLAKLYLPTPLRKRAAALRRWLPESPIEEANVHDYKLLQDASPRPRLSLVMPTIARDVAFGGVLTGLDIFLDLGLRCDVQLRLILDEMSAGVDRSVLDQRAIKRGIDPSVIEVVPRRKVVPEIEVRENDVFLTYNWWVTLNVRKLVQRQAEVFGKDMPPYLYLIQDYEPQFYPFSSAHMMARLAFDRRAPFWAIYNTTELRRYCEMQGHHPTRTFVFEPRMSDSLRPYLSNDRVVKQKRILVYGRPNIPRNCFSALCRGLSAWIDSDPDHASWEIVSAGTQHRPISLSRGRSICSLGKLTLDEYAALLQQTAVGVSLMSSPHPSYPPLEMAHFGVITVTNTYVCKDFKNSHENIIALNDIAPETLAAGITHACARFKADPGIGLSARSFMPSFLRADSFECLDEIAVALKAQFWAKPPIKGDALSVPEPNVE